MLPLVTPRLQITALDPSDAAFILELLNEPAFLRNVGDKNVRTPPQARSYIEEGPMSSYARYGFGLGRVSLAGRREALGICGLLKRESLPHPDLGFAFLTRHWGQGYAAESASAVVLRARALGLPRLLAITSQSNEASARVLEKAGLRFERIVKLPEYEQPNRLFSLAFSP